MPGNRLRGAFGKLGILTTTVFLAHAVFVTLPALGELRADDGNDVPFRMDIRSVHSHVRQGTVKIRVSFWEAPSWPREPRTMVLLDSRGGPRWDYSLDMIWLTADQDHPARMICRLHKRTRPAVVLSTAVGGRGDDWLTCSSTLAPLRATKRIRWKAMAFSTSAYGVDSAPDSGMFSHL